MCSLGLHYFGPGCFIVDGIEGSSGCTAQKVLARHVPVMYFQEVTDFDPLFPFNLPPISKKFRETR